MSTPVYNNINNNNNNQWRAEAVGCLVPTRFLDALENIFYSSRKISDNLFLAVHQNFLSFIQILYFFALAVKFYE